MPASSTIAVRIRTLREQRRLTQAALGAELGVSRAHLTKVERGASLPGRELLVALANYFEVSLDWLAEGRGEPSPARALNEKEALLLFAFRHLPEEEADAHLNLMLKRTKRDS